MNNKKRNALAAEKFSERLQDISGGKIKLKEGSYYEKSHACVDVICTVCGHEWSPKAYSLMNGSGCYPCGRMAMRERAGHISKPYASEAEKAFALACYEAGMSYKEIGKMINRAETTVRRWCHPEALEKHRESSKRYTIENKDRRKKVQRRYYDSEHGRGVIDKASGRRRALKVHAIFDVEIDGRLVEVNNWELIKGDSDAMELFSFEGADEAWKAKQQQCKKLERISGIRWSVDHLVPLSRGGIHAPENFKLVPLADNSAKKNNVVPEDYALFARRIFNIN